MTALDRAGCALLRLAPQGRARDGLTRRWRSLVHLGRRVECPICGGRFREFGPRPNATGVVCWRCGSHERHRIMWLFLTRQRPGLLGGARSLLHFAPERGLEEAFRQRDGIDYVTCDLDMPDVDLRIDITQMNLPDERFDAIICSHVLEHVPDEAAALGELGRVLAPGGWCLIMVPLDARMDQTDDDPSVVDPGARRRRFWQHDHVRLYGRDAADRFERAGFDVEVVTPITEVDPAEAARYALGLGEHVFICRRSS